MDTIRIPKPYPGIGVQEKQSWLTPSQFSVVLQSLSLKHHLSSTSYAFVKYKRVNITVNLRIMINVLKWFMTSMMILISLILSLAIFEVKCQNARKILCKNDDECQVGEFCLFYTCGPQGCLG